MVISLLKNHSYKLAIFWALVILGLCSMPGRFIPAVSWLELLSFDKWVHAGIFFTLLGLLQIAVVSHKQSNMIAYFYFALCVLYGGALELMQAKLFSERSADWYDVIANSFGCIVALLLKSKITRLIFK